MTIEKLREIGEKAYKLDAHSDDEAFNNLFWAIDEFAENQNAGILDWTGYGGKTEMISKSQLFMRYTVSKYEFECAVDPDEDEIPWESYYDNLEKIMEISNLVNEFYELEEAYKQMFFGSEYGEYFNFV